MQTLIIYTDGGARGNPGPAGAGVVIIDASAGTQRVATFEYKKYLGPKQTNNWAEYEAVILALIEAKKKGFVGRALEFRLDSKLVVEQLSGNWKIKEAALKEQAAKARALLDEFPSYTFTYVPREQNKEADRLVNEAIDEAGA